MDRFSRPFGLTFINKEGRKKTVLMGCYGIGLGRLMGAIVEASNDEKGIIWPAEVSPYQIHLIQMENNIKIKKFSEKLYQDLQKANIEVLYDDRNNKTAGEKFADADLVGIPYRLVVSERTLIKKCIEIKKRNENRIKLAKIKSIIQQINSQSAIN
jgi:prolyl-tRNA synthetase